MTELKVEALRPMSTFRRGVSATNMDMGGMPNATIWQRGPHLCRREEIRDLSSASYSAAEAAQSGHT